jgi:uncharacterized protein YcnI
MMVVFVVALLALTAAAHVTVNPRTMVSGAKYQTLTFRLGHSCSANTTVTEMSVKLPPKEQVPAFKAAYVVGWKQNITIGGNATWYATSSDYYIPDSNVFDMPVSFSLGNFTADTNITFYIAQSEF